MTDPVGVAAWVLTFVVLTLFLGWWGPVLFVGFCAAVWFDVRYGRGRMDSR